MDFATAVFEDSPDGPREVFLRKSTYILEGGFGSHATTYPVTICPARYTGAYEGAVWLAFPVQPRILEEEAWRDWQGSDIECSIWWDRSAQWPIGKGASPEGAYLDLIRLAAGKAGINPDDWALQPTLDKDELRRRNEEGPAV